MAIDGKGIKVLIINGSPHKNSHSSIFAEAAADGARSLGADVIIYEMAGKRYEHCRETCKQYHTKTGNCCLDDDLPELANLWIKADGIIYVAPLFHMAIPSSMNAFLIRLGALVFSGRGGAIPRVLKVGGAIIQGNTCYGGQELAMQYLNAHLMLMNCLPVTGDMPEAYIGTGAQVGNDHIILRNDEVLENSRSLGVRIVEVAKIIKEGKKQLEESLPEEYSDDSDRVFRSPAETSQ